MITEDYSQVIVPKTKKNTINLKKSYISALHLNKT